MMVDYLLDLVDDVFLLSQFFRTFVFDFLQLLQTTAKVLDQIEFPAAHLLYLALVKHTLQDVLDFTAL